MNKNDTNSHLYIPMGMKILVDTSMGYKIK